MSVPSLTYLGFVENPGGSTAQQSVTLVAAPIASVAGKVRYEDLGWTKRAPANRLKQQLNRLCMTMSRRALVPGLTSATHIHSTRMCKSLQGSLSSPEK